MTNEPEWCCFGDGKKALRKVGRRGYCGDHTVEAFAACKGEEQLARAEGPVAEPNYLMEAQRRRRW